MTADRLEIALDLRAAASHLLQHPLVVSEKNPDAFRSIRRHGQQLDRWFTQRFGCRLQTTADSARLFRSTPTLGDQDTLIVVALWIAVVWSLVSGIQYLIDGQGALSSTGD